MDNIVSSVAPVYYVSKIFGMTIYKISSTGDNLKFVLCKKSMAYGCSVVSTTILLFIYLFYYIQYTPNTELILKMVFILQVKLSNVYLLSVIGTILFYSNSYIKCLNDFLDIDKKLRTLAIFINYKSVFKNLINLIFLELLFMVMALVIFYMYAEGLNMNLYLLSCFSYMCIRTTAVLQFQFIIMVIQEAYKALQENLAEFLAHYNTSNILVHKEITTTLCKTGHLYKKLGSILRVVNNIYGVQLLMYTAHAFLDILTHTYNIFLILLSRPTAGEQNDVRYKQLLMSTLWVAYFTTGLILLIHFCAKLTNDVSILFPIHLS